MTRRPYAPPAPSTLARRVAAHHWGRPDTARRIAPGVHTYTTPAHGGLVAVLDAADLPGDTVSAAEACGLIETWYSAPARSDGTGCRIVGPECDYRPDVLAQWLARMAAAGLPVTAHRAWVGEEDAGWSTLAYASAAVRHGLRTWPHGAPSRSEVREVAARWFPAFTSAVDGLAPGKPGHYLRGRVCVETTCTACGVVERAYVLTDDSGGRDGGVCASCRTIEHMAAAS